MRFQALPSEGSDKDPLCLAALKVEQNARLNAEMAEWEASTLDDGLVGVDSSPAKP